MSRYSGQLPPLLSLAAGTCGVLLRKVNGTAIVQLPSKRHMQVEEPRCPWDDPLGTKPCILGEACSSSLSLGAGDLRGHGGPRVQCRPQQAGYREGGTEPLAGQAPAHGLVASQGGMGRAQDQASSTHEELRQPAADHSTGVMLEANKAFSVPPLSCYCCLFCAGPRGAFPWDTFSSVQSLVGVGLPGEMSVGLWAALA